MRRPVIGVMGPGSDTTFDSIAFELGGLIAREGWILLTGGRNAGVMDAASRGAKSVPGSITVGVLPTDCGSRDVSPSVDVAIFTNMGDARNAINVQSSDVVVAVSAASAGTLSEVALALKADKPVVLLGAGTGTRTLLQACDRGNGNVQVADTAADAIRLIKALGIHSWPWHTA
jgi:uncharacterized protein (TIGR00725 family)